GLRVPGLRVRMYSFRDPPHVLLQGLRVAGLRVRIYCLRDFVSPDFVSAYTALGTSGPRTSCPHVLLQGPSACTPSGTSGRRTSRPHLLLQGRRVPGFRVRIYYFRDFGSPDFGSAFTA
ncbi:hypothetical protein CRG98_046765, partial [Punica granatum]